MLYSKGIQELRRNTELEVQPQKFLFDLQVNSKIGTETTKLKYTPPTEERTIFELQGLPKNVNRITHSACWLSYYRVGINEEQHC